LLCLIAIPFALSKVLGPMYLDRYTISAAPAFYLLLAFGLASIRKVVPLLVSVGTLVILIAPGLYYYYAADVKEQWREVAEYVEAHSRPSDAVVLAPDENGAQQQSFLWYYRGSLPACGLGADLADDAAIAAGLTDCTSGHERFWLLMRGTAETVGRFKGYFLNRSPAEMELTRQEHFTGIWLFLFELPG
jgi:hypothetical protein